MRKAYGDVEGPGKGRPEPRARPTWQEMRKDWKPFDPSKSLAQQQTFSGNRVIKAMLRPPPVSHAIAKPNMIAGQGDRKLRPLRCSPGASNTCEQQMLLALVRAPLDCIRKAYHGRMKGTKFERVGSAPSSSTSAEGLTEERERVAREVAQGKLSGTSRVPQHSKLATSIQRAREALDRELAAEAKDETSQAERTKEKPSDQEGANARAPSLSSFPSSEGKLSAAQLLRIVRSRARSQRLADVYKEKENIVDAERAYKEGELAAKAYDKGELDAREYEAGLQAGKKFGKLASGNENSYVVLPLKPSGDEDEDEDKAEDEDELKV